MDEIMIGGRRFRVIDFDRRTVLQDHYLQKLVRTIGADKVMPMDGELNAAYLVRMQAHLIDSGRAHELIAGFLIPDGESESDFTVEGAKKIARHIAGCSTQEDRDLVIRLSMDAVFGFFRQGLDWLKRSHDFSGSVTSEPASPETSQALH